MSAAPRPVPPARDGTTPTADEPEAVGTAGTASAIRDLGSHIRFWLVAVLGLTVDLWSKSWAFRELGQNGKRVLIPHVLELQTMMNDGALFGIGRGQTALFVVASFLALGLVLWMFAASSPRNWWLHIAFGAILAGAAGNMYDRVFVRLVALPGAAGGPVYYEKTLSPDGQSIVLREYPARTGGPQIERPAAYAERLPREVGQVRDFLKIPTRIFGKYELWRWVFNVADALLVCGVALLALRLWQERGAGSKRPAALDSPAAPA